MSCVTDGKYNAHLADATLCKIGEANGVNLVFEIEDTESQVSCFLVATSQNGHPNRFGIQTAQLWAKGWDGADFAWFARELKKGTEFNVTLTIHDGGISLITYREVIKDKEPIEVSETGTDIEDLKFEIHPENVENFPKEIPPTAEAILTYYYALTEGSDRTAQWVVWVRLANRIGPRQSKFTEADWKSMLRTLRKLAEKKRNNINQTNQGK